MVGGTPLPFGLTATPNLRSPMKNALSFLLVSFALCFAISIRADEKPAAPVANVAGTWNLVVETGQGPATPVFIFNQQDEKLTGHYKGALGEASVTGSVKGNSIQFEFKGNLQGQDLDVTYTGTVDGDTMKGTARYGSFLDGTFTGKRQSK